MTKYFLIAVVFIVAVMVVVIRHQRPSGEAPDLDAAALDTGKNLHPPKLQP